MMFQQTQSTIIPRYYQLEAIDAIYNYFMHKDGNPLIGLPCGTGKSIIPALFIHRVMQRWPNQRFLLMTTVKELIEQNSEKLKLVWPNAPLGLYSAGLKQKQTHLPIIYGTIQSMIKRPELFGHRDMIFCDECHLVSQNEDSMYLRFFSIMKMINPAIKIVGMSATLYRMGQGLLTEGPGNLFNDVCYDMTNYEGFNRLLAEGYLCPLVPKRTKTELDVSDVGMANGDYIGSQLEKAVDKNEITYKGLQEVISAGSNRKSWVIFASGIEHAEHIATIMNNFGVDCAPIHSRQREFGRNDEYNDKALKAFKDGSLRSIVNYNKVTIGFDNPAIDLIADFRPTLSIPLHVQKYGRGLRVSNDKKNCLILDFARNTQRLGCINDVNVPKKKSSKEGDIPVKICDNCGTYNHLKVRFCTECGQEFQFQIKITPKAGNTEILRSDMPVVETFDVDKVIYVKRQKLGKPPYIQATYFCGMQGFNEFCFPEHNGYAKHRFSNWWKQRHETDPPGTVIDALKYVNELRTPKRIRVWCNRRYPEVLSAEF